MPGRAERDLLVEKTIPVVRSFYLHVNPYSFRMWRSNQEIAQIQSKSDSNLVSREQFLEDIDADENGNFTFIPRKLYLAYTQEEVLVPDNESWRFRSYFIMEDSGQPTLLTTNLTAPTIQPGSRGPQTYEILNESDNPLTVHVPNLACIVAVFRLTGNVQRRPETFAIQTGQRPRLGNLTRW